jgi:hypothetical protein
MSAMESSATFTAAMPLSRRGAALLVSAACAAFLALIFTHFKLGYVDFGDGNYMYISWRLSEGAVLYRDILAPQPPVHLYLGALIALISRFLHSPTLPFRVFSAVLHCAVAITVYFCAVRVTGGNSARDRAASRLAGVLAAIIYLVLPLGFWWSIGYQSEPTEILLLMLSFLLLISWDPGKSVLAGFLAAVPPLVNMTAAPYTLFSIGYVLLRQRRLFLRYCLPVVLLVGAVIAGMELWTHAYLENVILNQVGSFPRKEFLPKGQNLWTYATGKIWREGGDVLRLEGYFVFTALLGLLHYSRRGSPEHREYVSWYAFFSLCSILYVSKGGTMDYIFTIGEPFVAIFAGYFIFTFVKSLQRGAVKLAWVSDLSSWASYTVAAVIVLIALTPGALYSWATLNQRTYELPEDETLRIVDQVRTNVKPDGLVLAPPYYAFLAGRHIAKDYSELFLWSLKYANERQDKQEGRGVKTVLQIEDLLKHKKIDYIVLDLDQTGRIPEIKQAIERNYVPVRASEFRTLNTRLQFYKPRT